MNLKKKVISVFFMFLMFLVMFSAGGRKVEAAQTGSITITDDAGNKKSTSWYSAYQIVTFNATRDSDNKVVFTNMKLGADYKSVIINTIPTLNNNSTDKEILTAMSKLNADQTAALAIALKVASTNITTTYLSNEGVISNLAYGYYLVIEKVNNANDGTVISNPILVCIPDTVSGDANVVIKAKTSKAKIEKKIVESNNNLVDSSTAAIGDKIFYQSLSSIPSFSASANNIVYSITDTFSAGLSFDANSIQAFIIKEDGTVIQNLDKNQYTLATSGIGDATFKLSLNTTSIANIKSWGNLGYKLLVTYSAILNDIASSGSTGNPNSIKLNYKTDTYDITSDEDTVITYTTKLKVIKTDSNDDNKFLKDAIFELSIKNSDGSWTIVDNKTTGIDGSITFNKLKQGNYKLVEKTAPSGYELLPDPIEFTVSAKNGSISIPDKNIIVSEKGNVNALTFKATWESTNASIIPTDGIFTANIKNDKGFILPGTGGIGTTIFTVCGIVIILLGSCMAVLYFKRNKAVKQQ